MCDSPDSPRAWTLRSVMSRAPSAIVPLVTSRMPAIASSSSVCPFPSTPAIPRISPAATVNETSFTARSIRGPRTTRWRTSSATAPAAPGALRPSRTERSTSRPTIALAIFSGDVSRVAIVATVSPRRMTVTFSLTVMTSSSLCVMSTIVAPPSRRRRSTFQSSATSGGESTAVGSSSSRIRAPR